MAEIPPVLLQKRAFREKLGLSKPVGIAETNTISCSASTAVVAGLQTSWPASFDLSEAQSEFVSYPVGYFYASGFLLALD